MNIGSEVRALDDELSLGRQFLAARALESLSRTKESAIAACGVYWPAS